MKILDLQPDTFGLDISAHSLKIAQLKEKGVFSPELTLAGYNSTPIPEGAIQKAMVVDQDALCRTIKKGYSKAENINTNFVSVSLPEQKAFLEIIQMPKMSKEEIKESVKYEAENYIPMSMEDVYLDSEIITPTESNLDHTDVLIVGFPKKIVDPYINCLEEAGLRPVNLEVETQAMARALIKDFVSRKPLLIVDLGATKTTIMVYSGRALRFTAYIPISSRQFTRVISERLDIDWEKAEKMKIEHGLSGSEEAQEISNALQPILTDLERQISEHMEYYKNHDFHEHLLDKKEEINKVLLTGGGSNLKGLPEALSSRLGVPAEMGNPWVNILGEDLRQVPKMSFEKSSKYTVALGLALRSFLDND